MLGEHGNVSSHFQLEKAANKIGIKPIFGLEAYCGSVDVVPCDMCSGGTVPGVRDIPCSFCVSDPSIRELCPFCAGTGRVTEACENCSGKGVFDNRSQWKNHLTILAENADGYRSLNRIVTQSYRDYYYHPTVSGASLAANRDGLVVLSGCSGSLLACSLLGGKGIPEPQGAKYAWDDARLVIDRFSRLFGDRYFLEVQPFWELDRTQDMNRAYEKLSRETGVPMVVTCDVHYPRPEDSEMQAILHAVHRGNASVDDQLRSWNYDVKMCLPESDEELAGRLVKTGLSKRAAWDAIETSARIADMCNVTLPKAERLRYRATEEDLRPWV